MDGAGVVDEDVETAICLDGLGYEGLDALGVAHVDLDGGGGSAGGGDLVGDGCDSRFGGFGVWVLGQGLGGVADGFGGDNHL